MALSCRPWSLSRDHVASHILWYVVSLCVKRCWTEFMFSTIQTCLVPRMCEGVCWLKGSEGSRSRELRRQSKQCHNGPDAEGRVVCCASRNGMEKCREKYFVLFEELISLLLPKYNSHFISLWISRDPRFGVTLYCSRSKPLTKESHISILYGWIPGRRKKGLGKWERKAKQVTM